MNSVVAIRHVHFEGLATFEPVLREAGNSITYLDIGRDDLATLDPLQPDLLVVLGAPVGDAHRYATILHEAAHNMFEHWLRGF